MGIKSKTVFSWGGKNHYENATAESLVQLDQRQDKNGRFTVTYGLHVKSGLCYADAAKELGECILHALSCDGIVNNDGI